MISCYNTLWLGLNKDQQNDPKPKTERGLGQELMVGGWTTARVLASQAEAIVVL